MSSRLFERAIPTIYCLICSGCTHFIIGRDMAGSKSSLSGQDFYGAYEAQEMAGKHALELGMPVWWDSGGRVICT